MQSNNSMNNISFSHITLQPRDEEYLEASDAFMQSFQKSAMNHSNNTMMNINNYNNSSMASNEHANNCRGFSQAGGMSFQRNDKQCNENRLPFLNNNCSSSSNASNSSSIVELQQFAKSNKHDSRSRTSESTAVERRLSGMSPISLHGSSGLASVKVPSSNRNNQQLSPQFSQRFYHEGVSGLQGNSKLGTSPCRGSMQRHVQLYEMGEAKRLNLERKQQEKEEMRERESEEFCTFQPTIYTKNSIYNRTQMNSALTVFERSNLWNEQKKRKIEMIVNSDQNRNSNECTFRPEIKSSQKSLIANMSIFPGQNENPGLNGVDKFLRRQLQARRAKEEFEISRENPFCHVENKSVLRTLDQNNVSQSRIHQHQQQQNFNNNNNKSIAKRISTQPSGDSDSINFDNAVKSLRKELHNIRF